MGRIDFDDLQGEGSYSGSRVCDQSKPANMLVAYELARRRRGTRVTSNAMHLHVDERHVCSSSPSHRRAVEGSVRPVSVTARLTTEKPIEPSPTRGQQRSGLSSHRPRTGPAAARRRTDRVRVTL
jgi:hypothetical protein